METHGCQRGLQGFSALKYTSDNKFLSSSVADTRRNLHKNFRRFWVHFGPFFKSSRSPIFPSSLILIINFLSLFFRLQLFRELQKLGGNTLGDFFPLYLEYGMKMNVNIFVQKNHNSIEVIFLYWKKMSHSSTTFSENWFNYFPEISFFLRNLGVFVIFFSFS